jgi:hypothetical protein
MTPRILVNTVSSHFWTRLSVVGLQRHSAWDGCSKFENEVKPQSKPNENCNCNKIDLSNKNSGRTRKTRPSLWHPLRPSRHFYHDGRPPLRWSEILHLQQKGLLASQKDRSNTTRTYAPMDPTLNEGSWISAQNHPSCCSHRYCLCILLSCSYHLGLESLDLLPLSKDMYICDVCNRIYHWQCLPKLLK